MVLKLLKVTKSLQKYIEKYRSKMNVDNLSRIIINSIFKKIKKKKEEVKGSGLAMVCSFLQLKLAQSLSKKLKSVKYRREYRTLRVRPTCSEWGFYYTFQFGKEIFFSAK